jgi:uncharacterized protein (DUF1778 family)
MAALPSNPARLSFRLASDQKDLIERAAVLNGQSVSDFAIASLIRAAREAIEADRATRLSLKDGEAFLKMLDSNSEPNDALKKAFARHKAAGG